MSDSKKTQRRDALDELKATYRAILECAAEVRSEPGIIHPDGDFDYEEWWTLGADATRQDALRQLIREALTEWNEGAGAAVEEFWRRAAERGIDVRRKQDIVSQTLARGRVLNPPQFYELDDHFEELQECGKITCEEAERLERMLDAFEANPKNFDWVSSR